MEKKLVCVAKVGAPHGVRGDIRLKTYTADPASIADYSPLFNKDGSREFKIKVLSVKNDMVTVKIDGVDNRGDAAKLTNMELFADKELFGEPDEGEFFYDDLIGMDVFTESGEKFGVALAVENFGGGDVIEISMEETGKKEYFAFTKETFPTVNVKEGFLIIDPPEKEFVSDNDNGEEND